MNWFSTGLCREEKFSVNSIGCVCVYVFADVMWYDALRCVYITFAVNRLLLTFTSRTIFYSDVAIVLLSWACETKNTRSFWSYTPLHGTQQEIKSERERVLSEVPELIQIVSSEKYDWMKRHTHTHIRMHAPAQYIQQLHSVQTNVSHYEINANKFNFVERESIVSDAKMWDAFEEKQQQHIIQTLLAQLNWFQFSMHLCRIKLFLWTFCSFVSFFSFFSYW